MCGPFPLLEEIDIVTLYFSLVLTLLTSKLQKTWMFKRPNDWNHLLVAIRSSPSVNCLNQTLAVKHLAHAFNDCQCISLNICTNSGCDLSE